jgi:hypothetical protein
VIGKIGLKVVSLNENKKIRENGKIKNNNSQTDGKDKRVRMRRFFSNFDPFLGGPKFWSS